MNEFEPRLTRHLRSPYSRIMADGSVHPPEGAPGADPADIFAGSTPEIRDFMNSLIPPEQRRQIAQAAAAAEANRQRGGYDIEDPDDLSSAVFQHPDHQRRVIVENLGGEEKNAILNDVRSEVVSGDSRSLGMTTAEIEEEKRIENANVFNDRQETKATVAARARLLLDREFRDEVFNNIFATVDANPSEFWDRAFNYYTHGLKVEAYMSMILNGSMNRDEFGLILTQVERDRLAEDFYRYQNEIQVRKTLHDLNAILYLPSIKGDQLYDSLQQFAGIHGDIAIRLPGVNQMMNVYEQILREKMMQNGGYLTPTDIRGQVIAVNDTGKTFDPEEASVDTDDIKRIVYVGKSDAEKLARERFISLMNAGQITAINEQSGKSSPVTDLKPWEIDRIFTTARGMMIASERLLSLAAESKLPPGASRYMSSWMQDVLQQYSPYRHLLGKFGITEQSLSAYLYSEFDKNGLKELKRALERFEHLGLDILNAESLDALRYITRQNPNRAGDIFTWVSWRVVGDKDTMSFVNRFLEKGAGRMKGRWEARNGNLNVPQEWSEEYTKWIGTGIRFEKMRGDLEKVDKVVYEKLMKRLGGLTALDVEERGLLESLSPKERAMVTTIAKAEKLFKRISLFQPHRLYLTSDDVRARVNAVLFKENVDSNLEKLREKWDEEDKHHEKGSHDEFREEKRRIEIKKERLKLSKENMDKAQRLTGILLALETSIINRREALLDGTDPICPKDSEGRGIPVFFDDINIADFIREDIAKPDGERIIRDIGDADDAIRLAEEVRKDFISQNAKGDVPRNEFGDNVNGYYKEWIKEREYKHGFVLWTGDANLNEYVFEDVHDTGAFARRARDNKAQGEAATKEIELLEALPKIESVEQIAEGLEKIWAPLSHFDAAKANQTIMEKAIGIAWLFKEKSSSTYLPVAGVMQRRLTKDSMAQVLWGKNALAVGPADLHHLFAILYDHKKISKEQYQWALNELNSGRMFIALDAAVNIGQLGFLGFLLYMFSKSVNLPK